MELVLRTSTILVAAWLASRLLTRASAATRHLLWHSALLTVLVAPLVPPLIPRFAVPGLASALDDIDRRTGFLVERISEKSWIDQRLSTTVSGPFLRNGLSTFRAYMPVDLLSRGGGAEVSSRGDMAPTMGATEVSSKAASRDLAPNGASGTRPVVTVWWWPAGTLAVGLWFFIGWMLALRTARCAPDAPAAWQTETAAIAARLRIGREVRLGMLPADSSPLTVGLMKPRVLLPPSAATWDADQRRAVLLHELAHVRRHDARIQLMLQAACAMYWFNPLIWLASRALRRERERACDDEVLRGGAKPSAYAECLLSVARLVRRDRLPSAALAMARSSELEGRLLALLDDRARQPSSIGRALVSTIVAVCAVAALGASPTSPVVIREPLAAKSFAGGTAGTWAMMLPDERSTDRETIEQAATTLRTSPDASARERAAGTLAQSAPTSSIDVLAGALSDPSSSVREKAAMALALQSGADVVEPLIRALADPDSQVREKAAMGLALRRDPRVVEPLLEAIQDSDSQVREKAAIALGTSGDPRARAALEAATRDPDAQVREKAITGLMLLSTPASSSDGERLRDGLRDIVGMIIGIAR